MAQYFKDRFEVFRQVTFKLSTLLEVNEILETIREEEKRFIASAKEVCVLLLDPEAHKYTKPLQCALYDRPLNCLLCKRNRAAVQKALRRRKGSVISRNEPITRHDGTQVSTGPEAAIPVFVEDEIVAVINVVARPGIRFTKKEFLLMKDISELTGVNILRGRRQWENAQDKVRISSMLSRLSPFVPKSVREIVENNPDLFNEDKAEKEVSVLFLDLEGYTRLFKNHSELEVNRFIEDFFSNLIDPIHRSGGDINETAGDGLMIIFQDEDASKNAMNAVQTAFDIQKKCEEFNRQLKGDFHPLSVNIGIDSGKVLLGMSRFKGSFETRMTYTATGSVTNKAARLADEAKGGDILIGESTKELVEGLWPVFGRGRVSLKNMDGPIPVYSMKPKGHVFEVERA